MHTGSSAPQNSEFRLRQHFFYTDSIQSTNYCVKVRRPRSTRNRVISGAHALLCLVPTKLARQPVHLCHVQPTLPPLVLAPHCWPVLAGLVVTSSRPPARRSRCVVELSDVYEYRRKSIKSDHGSSCWPVPHVSAENRPTQRHRRNPSNAVNSPSNGHALNVTCTDEPNDPLSWV